MGQPEYDNIGPTNCSILDASFCRFERNPLVRLFCQNLRHRVQAALIQPPAGANCEPDEDELLTTVTGTADPDSSPSASAASEHECALDCTFTDSDNTDDNEPESVSTSTSLESCSVR
jgi:hypothetical protein